MVLFVPSILAEPRQEDQPERFIQKEFVIGYWVTPPQNDDLDERFKEIAEAHFNLILAGYDPQSARIELELCRKYGLNALFWHMDDQTARDPLVWGRVVGDEPGLPDRSFEMYHKRYREFMDSYPGKLGFINLYPNYASKKQLGFETYEEHVATYMKMFQPDVLCMDHYPVFKPHKNGREGYCENLATMRKYSLTADIPFWNFFNTMPYGEHTDPTEAQLRWQAYTSVVYGAKGVLYYCYYTPGGKVHERGGAIIDTNGNKTRHYDQAQRLNAELTNLGPTLMQLTSTGVYRVEGQSASNTVLNRTLIRSIVNGYSKDVPLDLQIGAFDHTDGRKAVMVQNYRYAYTAWMTIAFDAGWSNVVEIDRKTGQEVAVYDDSPAMDGMQISLDAGEGRLFLIRE